nr:ankyrin repeat and zinc finger domain-containing protein 1 isoform X3 [Anser cygnoides]
MAAPRSRSVFLAAQDAALLHGLSLVTRFAAAGHGRAAASPGEEKGGGVPEVPEVPEGMWCSACAQRFGSREEQIEHYRLDWHRFNLKQRLLGRRALPMEVFEEKTTAGDISSISGSDSESSDASSESELQPPASSSPRTPQLPRSHKVLLRNASGQLISAYRCVLSTGKPPGAGAQDLPPLHGASPAGHSPEPPGRPDPRGSTQVGRSLPAALQRGRAAQELPMPTLRAYDPTVPPLPTQDIQDLLTAWAHHLKEAQRIFLRAPRHNRALLFGGRNPPLSQGDPRICHIPLSTRRATLREVLRVHTTLASLQVYGKDTPLEDIVGSPRKGWQKRQRTAEADPLQKDASALVLSPPSAPEDEEEEEEESPAGELETVEVTLGTLDLREFEVMPKRNRKRRKKRNKKVENGPHAEETGCSDTQGGQPGPELVAELQEEAGAEPLPWAGGDPQTQLRDTLFTACKTGDVGTLQHLLGVPENRGSLEEGKDGKDAQHLDLPRSLLNQPLDEHGFTLLHVAARAGKAEAVRLLLEAGADPALRDRQERTPYCVSADKPTRNTFRKFMVDHPDKYDYSRAKVPGPLTLEMEAKKQEKKRAQKAQRKQREQAQREERQRWEQEEGEKQRFAALSDREKRALAAERRLAEQKQDGGTTISNISRCWHCGESLLGRIPFHYLDFSFCSTACLQTHRRARAGPT